MPLQAPRRYYLQAALGLASSLWPLTGLAQSQAPVFQARIASVQDGDSFSVLDRLGRRERIRLAGIDAPELQQAHGENARAALEALVDGYPLEVHARKRDPFGRIVARVYRIDPSGKAVALDLAREQVRQGHAWVFTRYAKEQPPDEVRADLAAQEQARKARSGLWAHDGAEPPWEFRRNR